MRGNSKTSQDGDQEDLRHFAARQGINESPGNESEQERKDSRFLGAADICCGNYGIEDGRIDVETFAGLKNYRDDDADDEGESRHDFKIDKRLDADPADFFEVGHRSDALNDGAENHRRDHHANEHDESVAERFQGYAHMREKTADENSNNDGNEHLHVENRVPGLASVRHGGIFFHGREITRSAPFEMTRLKFVRTHTEYVEENRSRLHRSNTSAGAVQGWFVFKQHALDIAPRGAAKKGSGLAVDTGDMRRK
jgi:hypothetical protein